MLVVDREDMNNMVEFEPFNLLGVINTANLIMGKCVGLIVEEYVQFFRIECKDIGFEAIVVIHIVALDSSSQKQDDQEECDSEFVRQWRRKGEKGCISTGRHKDIITQTI